MPFPPISTGGRGAGFMLGPEQNVFTGADRAAAETARDNYFTANPSNLAQYNSDNSLNIRLEYDDGGDAVAQFQVRNSADNAWLDNDSAIGVRGDDGTATIPGVADGTIPMVQGGALVASSMREVANLIESGKSLGLPDNSVNFLNLRVSASQGRFIAYDMLNEVYAMIGSRPLTAAGTGDYTVEMATARQGPVLFQPRFADNTHTTNDLSFNFTNISKAIIDNWITRGTAGKFYIQIHDGTDATGRVIYRSHTPAQIATGDVFDLTGNDGTSDFLLDTALEPSFQDEGQELFVRLLSPDANTFTVLGTVTTQSDVDANPLGFTVVGQNVPYFGTRFWPIVDERILTADDLRTDAQVRTLAANMVLNGTHNGLTVQRVGDVLNFNVTGTTPPIAPDPSVSALDIGVPATIPIGFNFNTTRDIRFTTQATSQITALTLVMTGADDVTLTVPSTDGSHTQSVAFTGASTGVAGTITAQIRGTTSGGQNIMSNTQTITIQDAADHEQAYVWAATTQNFADQDLASASVLSFDVTRPGSTFEVANLTVPDGSYINVLYPNDRPITSIIEPPLNLESITEFPESTSVRTIGGQVFNGRSDQNNAGQSVSFSATFTVGG